MEYRYGDQSIQKGRHKRDSRTFSTNTVHTVNAADYTEEQLDAWADGMVTILRRGTDPFREHRTLVAVMTIRGWSKTIVGFPDVDSTDPPLTGCIKQ